METFEWSKSLLILMKSIYLNIITFILLCQIVLLYPIITWIILLLDCIFFVLILIERNIFFNPTKLSYIGKKKESRNVISTIKATDLYPKRPVIIFSAHHDSVSSRYPLKMIKILYISSGLFFLFYLILSSLLSVWTIIVFFSTVAINNVYFLIRNISFIFGIALMGSIFIMLFNKKTNKSTGSIDNASGVAILLELAKLIRKNPLEKTDVIFLWCGAKEMGNWGTKQYCTKHLDELDYDYDLNMSYNFNVDMVGSNISILEKTGLIKKKRLNDNLNDVLEASATKQMIPLEKYRMTFAKSSDHVIFQEFTKKVKKTRFQVCWFFSYEDSKFVHSKKDTPDKCSTINLNACIDVCFNAIRSLDLRVE